MGIHVLHHPRKPTGLMPVNTSPNYCGCCWAAPGREHGLACPAITHRDNLRVFRGLLNALPLAVALDAIVIALVALLIRSL
ncbi:hypothetical protein [Micromonospora sp. DPT]|uniref:hypothetical protein n=1 Tax=Micromonospora sp. DPT TaxID=3142975 RepID=UPI00320950E6